MEQLTIEALKSACGNRHFKFQVIIDNHQLHIYVNYRSSYQPDRAILEENVAAAIASLNLAEIEEIWLYGRPLTQTEPEWQVFIELPTKVEGRTEDTDSSDRPMVTEADSNYPEFISTDAKRSNSESENLPRSAIDTIPGDLSADIELNELSDLTDFINFEADDSAVDTGLLQDKGFVHGGLLQEAEINTFAPLAAGANSEIESKSAQTNSNSLDRYCFVTNKSLLTDTAPAPDKDIVRMVKFLHYLSESDRDRVLPILDSYFRGGITPGLEETVPAVQNWFEQIKALNEDKQRTFFIWLSRYCFNPARTLEEFQIIAAQNAAEENKKTRSSTEYRIVNPKAETYPPKIESDLADEPSPMSIVRKNLLPGLWCLATMVFICLGIMHHNANIVVAMAQAPSLCDDSIGSKEYCRLAVNLAGEKAIAQAKTNLFPMTEVTETVADYGCARYTNRKAGIEIANIAPETTPVLASRGEKIFPHIYVVQTEQKQAESIDKIKVGCVYTTGKGQRSPTLVAADLIPIDWPASYYQKQSESDISFGIYASPIELGLYSIFAALGLALSSWLNLGLRISRVRVIYLVALILGLVQLTTALLSSFGLLGAIAMPILTILATSFIFKDFQLNWSRGYPSVAISVLTVIAVQFLLYSFCLGLINSLV